MDWWEIDDTIATAESFIHDPDAVWPDEAKEDWHSTFPAVDEALKLAAPLTPRLLEQVIDLYNVARLIRAGWPDDDLCRLCGSVPSET